MFFSTDFEALLITDESISYGIVAFDQRCLVSILPFFRFSLVTAFPDCIFSTVLSKAEKLNYFFNPLHAKDFLQISSSLSLFSSCDTDKTETTKQTNIKIIIFIACFYHTTSLFALFLHEN